MKKIIGITLTLSIILLITINNISAKAPHRVKSYIKRNGTYVPSHRKTNPDKTKYNNYSTKGNYNPYTGKEGTKYPNN